MLLLQRLLAIDLKYFKNFLEKWFSVEFWTSIIFLSKYSLLILEVHCEKDRNMKLSLHPYNMENILLKISRKKFYWGMTLNNSLFFFLSIHSSHFSEMYWDHTKKDESKKYCIHLCLILEVYSDHINKDRNIKRCLHSDVVNM